MALLFALLWALAVAGATGGTILLRQAVHYEVPGLFYLGVGLVGLSVFGALVLVAIFADRIARSPVLQVFVLLTSVGGFVYGVVADVRPPALKPPMRTQAN